MMTTGRFVAASLLWTSRISCRPRGAQLQMTRWPSISIRSTSRLRKCASTRTDATVPVSRPTRPIPATTRTIANIRPSEVVGWISTPLNSKTQTLQSDSPRLSNAGLTPRSAK